MKEIRDALGWGTNALALAVAACWLGARATAGVVDFSSGLLLAIGCLLLGVVWLGRALRFLAVWNAGQVEHLPRCWRNWMYYAMMPLLACAAWLVAGTNWPTRLLLTTHRQALEREARDPRQIVPRRQAQARVGWLGLYGKRRRGQEVFLALREGGFMGVEYFVLVYSPSGEPPRTSLLHPGDDGCDETFGVPAQRLDANWFWKKETCSW